MGDMTKIAWTDRTFNPWEGCQKVGPGCDNCYAETWNARFGGGEAPNWGPGAPRRRTKPANWSKPRRWNREAAEAGIRLKVFCASLADVFDNAVDPAWRRDLWHLISETPHLDWQLVTKRIGNVEKMVPEFWKDGWPPNVWLLITVVNQEEADRDAPKLLEIKERFQIGIVGLSMEPLLGAVDLTKLKRPHTHAYGAGHIDALRGWTLGAGHGYREFDAPAKLDWVIVGGESGRKARQTWVPNIRAIMRQCLDAGVACFVKQMGSSVADRNDAGFEGIEPHEWPDADYSDRIEEDLGGFRDGYQGAPIRIRLHHPKGEDMAE